MKRGPKIEDAIMTGVPRGDSTKRIREQTPPQARWQTAQSILEDERLSYDPKDPQGKVLFGSLGDKLIGIRDNRHILTQAGTRAGKSVTVIANLFFYDGSVFAIDPKGELATITAMARIKLGQKVHILDPFERVRGDAAKYRTSFNPVAILTLDNKTIIEDSMMVIDGFLLTTGGEKDPHWNESAAQFLNGFLLYIAVGDDVKEEDRNLLYLRKLVDEALNPDYDGEGKYAGYHWHKKIGAAAKRLGKQGHEEIAQAIIGAINGFYFKPSDERGSVLSTAVRHTAFLAFKSMKQVLFSGKGLNLRDLKSDPKGHTVYLCLPATRMSDCARWLRLMLNQFLGAMEIEETVPKSPVLTILDEFPALGYMKLLEDAIGQVASLHCQIWTLIQDWSQGTSLYGDRFQSFAANAGIWQSFGNTDVASQEQISNRLGDTLVEYSSSRDMAQSDRVSGQQGVSENISLFPLLTPNEVGSLFSRADPLKRQLVQWADLPNPMILQRVEYWDEDGPIAPFVD